MKVTIMSNKYDVWKFDSRISLDHSKALIFCEWNCIFCGGRVSCWA